MNSPPKIERLQAVLARTGLSRSALYALRAEGKFPPVVQISPRAIGFLSTDIDEWILRRVQASRP